MLRLEVQQLRNDHAIQVPYSVDDAKGFQALDAGLISWQATMQGLYTRAVDLKVLDAASETNLDFSLNTGEEDFEPKRDYVILAYLLMSIAVYFTDSIHLALILLHFNIFSACGYGHWAYLVWPYALQPTDLAVCFRVKALDDAFAAAVHPVGDAIEAMFLLV